MLEARPKLFLRADGNEGLSPGLLRAMFENADFGICLVSPERKFLAANAQFGEIFGIDPATVVGEDVQDVRDGLRERFADPETTAEGTNARYVGEDPSDDEIELLNPLRIIRRHSNIVTGTEGERLGRLWTFRDVTDERRLETMRQALYRVSVFNDPDPWRVCGEVARVLGEHYGANGVVSVLRDDFLEYRIVAGPPGPVSDALGSRFEGSCCRLPIETAEPVLVPDTLADRRTADCDVTRLGVASYMGAPLLSAGGTARGTLALMSGPRETPLDAEDLRFLSLLASRAATELERARLAEESSARANAIVAAQAADLEATREVLDAMVHAFDLVSFDEPIETVLVAQAALLENLLGFGTVAILAHTGSGGGPVVATPYEHRTLAAPEALDDLRRTTWLRRDALRQLGLDGFAEGLAVPLGGERRRIGVLVYEAERREELDEHRRTHLEAISEQVALTLEAHRLRTQLLATGRESEAQESRAVLEARLASSGLLAATVAHDLKNIVAAISLELAATSEPLRTLAAVRTHLDRFAVVSHRLLSYAKPRMVVKRPIDLDDLIRRLTGLYTEHLRISDIQLVISPAKMPTIVLGDPHQLEHLFANLVTNAIQAMSARNGGLIEIKLKRVGKRAVIEVRDTGPGLKEENLDKMFEPFVGFRHEGFGLGLFASRRIANEHGGDLKAASTPGVGTTFTLTLQAAPIEP